jgi:hypothetical protein
MNGGQCVFLNVLIGTFLANIRFVGVPMMVVITPVGRPFSSFANALMMNFLVVSYNLNLFHWCGTYGRV